MERTTDEIYDELRELRLTAEQIAGNIADVASAIQYFTNNLFDEQHNPDLTDSVRELAVYLHRVAVVANEEATSQVERAAEVVQEAVNEVLEQEVTSDSELSDDASTEESISDELPELPEMFEWRLKSLVKFLQDKAKQLDGHNLSDEKTVWQWWEHQFDGIRDAFLQLEFLEEKAVGEGMTLFPYIEQYGGIPSTILADEWPLEMVEAAELKETGETPGDADYSSEKKERSEKQKALFGQEEDCPPAAVVSPHETNGHAPKESLHAVTAAIADSNGASLESDDHSASSNEQHEQPYTLEDWQTFQGCIEKGDLTAEELQSQFGQMVAHEESITKALLKNHNAKQLKNWSLRWGRQPQSTKKANAKTIFQAMLGTFALGQTISYRPFDGETYGSAVAMAVEAITDEDIARVVTSRQAEIAAHEKAIADPETYEEWRLYVRSEGGYKNLIPERKIAYEQACADRSRSERADRKQKTISRLELDEDIAFSIKEGFHEKKDKPLWIVQLSHRVERETYKDLKAKAKELGGWFSSFKAEDTGFQFYDEAAAKLFTDLLDGDVDNAEVIEARKIRKMENASQRFHAVADTLERNSQEVLSADETKLKNTVRRAGMAAGMREDAQRGLATVKTLRALGDQLASDKIKYLDGVNTATQLETITKQLRAGKYRRITHELKQVEDDHSGYKRHQQHEGMLDEPLCMEDITFAEYPYPNLYRGHLDAAFLQLARTPGVMRVTKRMQKLIRSADSDKSTVAFRNSGAVEVLDDFLRRAKGAGYHCFSFDICMEGYNRLRAANIHNVFELRTAMHELLPYVTQADEDDPIVKAEEELIGKKLPGFFPTPKPIIYEMLELADIEGTDHVLEPSAGKGDILDAIRQAHSDVDLTGLEYNRTLRDVLVAKGYGETVQFGDFLEHEGEYDKIVMNPPFERGADMEHVRHAYDLLSTGGRLVSVMCRGPFFRNDTKSCEFRKWLDELDHDVQELPDNAFNGIDSFNQTGVSTSLVIINKSA